ncbi:MAG TPA: cbb3-type cytochrome c oxidase subunit 3 [Patescibacteria group bacterium]|nr:cbb3-type cytochrome c oxidase subunit 3 [Patescibacteria group bacterium]
MISGLVTAILLVTFVAGVFWAFNDRHKSTFDAAARLPLEDNEVKP